jgi:hypothetical protein
MNSFYTVQPETLARDEEDVSVDETVIESAPVAAGRLHEFNARGRTLKSAVHPLLPQGQTWITENRVNIRSQTSLIVRILWFVRINGRARVQLYSQRNFSCTRLKFRTIVFQQREPRYVNCSIVLIPVHGRMQRRL